ncbi:MAG TPA: cytochrome c peroxidase [Gemmatimonadaceae bacterium]|nr:cytochrome c peroxidase [Gemmatimonadaceae bacterium]
MPALRRSLAFPVFGLAISSTLIVALVSAGPPHLRRAGGGWTARDKQVLRSLALASLEPLQADPSNKYGDDPRAAALGREFFFDTRLSGNGKVSCASCHSPSHDFQDGQPLANGVGTTNRRTMPIPGTAHSPWQFWDGRADSQWEQALGPLESAVEHGGTRAQYAHVISDHYRGDYEVVFGKLPDLQGLPRHAGPVSDTAERRTWDRIPATQRDEINRVYANIGKAIAAYERRIEYGPSRFDQYVATELAGRQHTKTDALTNDEEAGLRLFIGKGSCVNCHNGPLFTDNHFHNTGVPPSALISALDSGRTAGVRQAVAGEFSCTSEYSDAKPEDCEELRFAVTEGDELTRAYKTPSLRNVAQRAPYMHAGQYATLGDVLAHYSGAPHAPFGHSELKPLRLSTDERRQLEAFLRTLSAPLVAPNGYLTAPGTRR